MSNELQITQSSPKLVLQSEHKNWWHSLSESQRKTFASVALALGISLVTLIAVKYATSRIRNAIAQSEQNNSFGEQNHATWAKQLKMAFDNNGWWGTDEAAVRQVLLLIPSQEDFRKVQISYRRLYKGRNLIEDLTDELKSTEFNEMLSIVQSKPKKWNANSPTRVVDPQGWAKRLYNAMSYYYMGFIPGTDELAIKAVFNEMTKQSDFEATKQAYSQLYGEDLPSALDGDLDWSMDWRALVNRLN